MHKVAEQRGLSVRRVPAEVRSYQRARWLAELADALEQAQKIAWQLGQGGQKRDEAMALYGRLEAARQEIQSLRIARYGGVHTEVGPYWTHLASYRDGMDEPPG